MATRRNDQHPEGRGQSLVEFAVVLPVFIFFLLGLLEFGRFFIIQIPLQNAAHEGALYACSNPQCIYPDTGECLNPFNAVYHARRENESSAVQWEQAQVVFTVNPNPIVQGGYVTAQVSITIETLTTPIQVIVPEITLTGKATCKVLGPP